MASTRTRLIFAAIVFTVVGAATACVTPPPAAARKVVVMASSPTTPYGTVPVITPTYANLRSGQTAPTTVPVCSTTATAASPVGTYPSSCSGAKSSGETFTYVAGTVTVAPAPVTVTASSASVGVGDAVPAITASYSGLQNGQIAPATLPTCVTTATSASPSGTYPSTCSGAADPNYTFSYVNGTVSVGLQQVTVTASSGVSVYGSTVPPVTASYAGFQNGQTAPGTPPICTTTASSSSSVGAYGTSCSGAADANYTFVYVDGTDTVTPASATITASSASIAFGSPIPPVTPSYSGLVNGDTAAATAPTCFTTATSTSPVGAYTTTCINAVDPNYTFHFVHGIDTITGGGVVEVIATSATIDYGDALPAVVPAYSGFTGGQTAPATPPTCTNTATASSPAGNYDTVCSGASDPNFTFTYIHGTLTILKDSATVTASSDSMTYGGTPPAISPSYTGLRNGQTAPTSAPICSTTATSTSAVGSYPSSCSGADDPNYNFNYVNGSISVSPAAATVTASSPSTTYGTAPTITATYGGLLNGSAAPATAPTCSTTETATSPVGTYPSMCAGAADPNYTFSYVGGTVSATRAPVTVTASSPTVAYRSAVPAITASYSGLKNGAIAPATAPTCSTTATSTSNAGTYPSTCSGAADSNYTFTYVAGTATITKVAVTVTASSATMVSGGSVPTISASYAGFLGSQATPGTLPTCSTTATSASGAGAYPSSCSGAADPNYTFTYVNGTVTVTAAAPTVVGYAAYPTSGGHTTTVTSGSNNAAVTSATINVVNPTAAGFSTYTNLTIETSNGPQPAFCKAVGTVSFATCSSVGSGTMSTGAYVTDVAPNYFDLYTIVPGGKTAVQPSSFTILTDVPAADRGAPSFLTLAANNGILTYLPSLAPSGTFSLTFGYCTTGTATYSAANPACSTGVVNYGPTASSDLGESVSVSIVTENLYENVGTYVIAPTTAQQNSTFSEIVAPASAAIPKLQDSGVSIIGDVTVNSASTFTAIVPIPAGMTYVSGKLLGGDIKTAGVATLTLCTASGQTGCTAKTTGNYTATTYPYLEETLPTGSVAGGGVITMPSVSVQLKATGAVGTVGKTFLTEFILNTSTSLASVAFDGYPTTGSADVTPPKAAPAVLASTTITA